MTLSMEPWMANTLAASQLTSLPGFMATSVYPGFMTAASAPAGNALAAFNLSALTSLSSLPDARSGSSPPDAEFCSPMLSDKDTKSPSIVALRLKAREHIEGLSKTIAGQ